MKLAKRKEAILIFSAHSDDFVLGAGGTIANYAKEGKRVMAIIFPRGEMSHPWLNEKFIFKVRSKETIEACKVLGCETSQVDLKEANFAEDYHKNPQVEKELLELIEKMRPSKIFTHSLEDPHPLHKEVHKITLELYEKLKLNPKPEVYTYSIWNLLSFKTDYPQLYVNITKNFGLKLKALNTFHSQKVHIAYPAINLFLHSLKYGFKIRTWFGERFFRIK